MIGNFYARHGEAKASRRQAPLSQSACIPGQEACHAAIRPRHCKLQSSFPVALEFLAKCPTQKSNEAAVDAAQSVQHVQRKLTQSRSLDSPNRDHVFRFMKRGSPNQIASQAEGENLSHTIIIRTRCADCTRPDHIEASSAVPSLKQELPFTQRRRTYAHEQENRGQALMASIGWIKHSLYKRVSARQAPTASRSAYLNRGAHPYRLYCQLAQQRATTEQIKANE